MTETQRIDPELDLLLRMRERLSDAANWCGDARGGRKGGASCLLWTLNDLEHSMHKDGLYVYRRLKGDVGDIVQFNDTHSHADVLALLDKAIAERTAELTA